MPARQTVKPANITKETIGEQKQKISKRKYFKTEWAVRMKDIHNIE